MYQIWYIIMGLWDHNQMSKMLWSHLYMLLPDLDLSPSQFKQDTDLMFYWCKILTWMITSYCRVNVLYQLLSSKTFDNFSWSVFVMLFFFPCVFSHYLWLLLFLWVPKINELWYISWNIYISCDNHQSVHLGYQMFLTMICCCP